MVRDDDGQIISSYHDTIREYNILYMMGKQDSTRPTYII